ncbi:MAG: hypothetical protein D6744_11470 [Planctomycetota bacterium]|nr:MAG: hypothetical protein D6744_11470 [Planctomycetota bacterium]
MNLIAVRRGARRATVAGLFATSLLLFAGCPLEEFTVETIFLRPQAEVVGSPADFGYEFDEVDIELGDDRKVSTWHVRANDPKGVVVVIPGSDRNKSRYLIGLPVFIPNGYDVILMDYEGFGDSSGGPLMLDRLVEDGLAVVEYALTQHDAVIAFGVSTGASPAVAAARQHDLAALILEAPLILRAEPELWLTENGFHFPFAWNVAVAWIAPQLTEDFKILKHIGEVDEPKLIMQSTEDEVVTFRSGQLVFEHASEPKTFFEMRGGHGDMIELEPELYTRTVIDWLDDVLSGDAQ